MLIYFHTLIENFKNIINMQGNKIASKEVKHNPQQDRRKPKIRPSFILPKDPAAREQLQNVIANAIKKQQQIYTEAKDQDTKEKIDRIKLRTRLIDGCTSMSLSRLDHIQQIFKHYCTHIFKAGKHMTFDRLEYEKEHLSMERFFLFLRDFELTSMLKEQKRVEVLDKNQIITIFKKISSNCRDLSFEQFIQCIEKTGVLYFDEKEIFDEKRGKLKEEKEQRKRQYERKKMLRMKRIEKQKYVPSPEELAEMRKKQQEEDRLKKQEEQETQKLREERIKREAEEQERMKEQEALRLKQQQKRKKQQEKRRKQEQKKRKQQERKKKQEEKYKKKPKKKQQSVKQGQELEQQQSIENSQAENDQQQFMSEEMQKIHNRYSMMEEEQQSKQIPHSEKKVEEQFDKFAYLKEENLLHLTLEEKIQYYYQYMIKVDSVGDYRARMTKLDLPNYRINGSNLKVKGIAKNSDGNAVIDQQQREHLNAVISVNRNDGNASVSNPLNENQYDRLEGLKRILDQKRLKQKSSPIPKPLVDDALLHAETQRLRKRQIKKQRENKAMQKYKQESDAISQKRFDLKKSPKQQREQGNHSVDWSSLGRMSIEDLKLKQFNPARYYSKDSDDSVFLGQYQAPRPRIGSGMEIRDRHSLALIHDMKKRVGEVQRREKMSEKQLEKFSIKIGQNIPVRNRF